MPDKTKEMIRNLDAYLKKVGAWTMDEVYDTRQEELEGWLERDQKKIAELKQQLTNATDNKQLKTQLKAAESHLTKHQQNLEKLELGRLSKRWF